MSPLIDSPALTLRDPTSLPAASVGLELLVIGLAAVTLVHAVRAQRRGTDRAALLTWITIAIYGLVMELVSYNFIQNFAHGDFTLSFYDRQLPLYITVIYPVLLYTGIATARRLGLPRHAEAIASGLFIVAMDAPFDVVGPVAGWWRWFDTDPNIAFRWYGVPVTSYYWHFTFGSTLALLTAWIGQRARRPDGPSPWLALPLGVATMLVGFLCFVPFHLAKTAGVSDGIIVATALIAGAAVVLRVPRRLAPERDRLLTAIWLAFYGYHVVVAIALAAGGGVDWIGRAAFVTAVAAVAILVRRPGWYTAAAS